MTTSTTTTTTPAARHQLYNPARASAQAVASAQALARAGRVRNAWIGLSHNPLISPAGRARAGDLKRQPLPRLEVTAVTWAEMAVWGGVSVSALKRWARRFDCGKSAVRYNMACQAWRAHKLDV